MDKLFKEGDILQKGNGKVRYKVVGLTNDYFIYKRFDDSDKYYYSRYWWYTNGPSGFRKVNKKKTVIIQRL